MRRITMLISLVVMLAGAQALTAAISDTYVIAAAHTRGAGGELWQSDLQLFNPDTIAVDVDALFVDATGAMRALGTTTTIAPQATMALRDVVGTAGGQGAIILSGSHPFVVTSRTYATTARGTVGESVLPISEFMDGTASTAYLTGLTSNASTRTNVGVFAAAGRNAPMTITIDVVDAAGVASGTRVITVPAGGLLSTQLPLTAIASKSLDGASATVRITAGDGVAAAYASVIDNATSDSMFIAGASGILPPGRAAAILRSLVAWPL